MSKQLDAQIDALYSLPLSQFVTARAALAKTVTGDEAKRIKALTKPTTLPWVVNQLRWHERAIYERLMKLGGVLRAAQVATLEGRATNTNDATAAHRKVLGEAVQLAAARARRDGVNVDADALHRMLETISLAETLPETHGRFTEAVQPAGFEALLGLSIKATATSITRAAAPATTSSRRPTAPTSKLDAAAERQAHREEQARQAAVERRVAAIARAEQALVTARQAETQARERWHLARDAADAAEAALDALRKPDA